MMVYQLLQINVDLLVQMFVSIVILLVQVYSFEKHSCRGDAFLHASLYSFAINLKLLRITLICYIAYLSPSSLVSLNMQ